MEDPTNAAVKATIEAALKPIEDIVKTIAGPAADELGLVLRDKVREYRFKRQIRFFTKFKQLCTDAGIKPKAVNIPLLMDILERASMEPDDDLQDLWANLLANAADPNYNGLITVTFPDILKHLSKEEAVLLDHMYEFRQSQPAEVLAEKWRKADVGTQKYVEPVYEDNLKRLGLILETDEATGFVAYSDNATPPFRFPSKRTFHLTALGTAFVKACTTPKKQNR
jgi:hypothetical protein